MTFVSYALANGTTVKTLAEAKASGQTYKVVFTEDRFAELHPTAPSFEEIEYRKRRVEALNRKHEEWLKANCAQ